MARPTKEEIDISQNKIVSRSDKKYTRISDYKKETFTNDIIFEFFLRREDFGNLYKKCKEELKQCLINNETTFYPMSGQFNSLCDTYKNEFLYYNYDAEDVIRYLYVEVCKEIGKEIKYIYKAYETNLQVLASSQYNLPPQEFDLIEKFDGSKDAYNSSFFKAYRPIYSCPIYMGNANFVNYRLNLKGNKESILKEFEILLDNTKEIEKKEYKPKYAFSKILGKVDFKNAFADYFYIYDHFKKGVLKNHVRLKIDEYRKELNEDSNITRKYFNISINTVVSHYKKMDKLFENNAFLELYWD